MVKAAGDKHRPAPGIAQGSDKLFRASHRRNALFEAFGNRAFIQPGEQPHPLAQCAFKVEFTLHCAFGDRGNMLFQPGKIGQFIDALLPDHGRIHVGDKDVRRHDFTRAHKHVARREIVIDNRTQLGGIAFWQCELQHIAAEIEHLDLGQPHACRLDGGGRAFDTRFKSLRVCYQPRDEHCEFS